MRFLNSRGVGFVGFPRISWGILHFFSHFTCVFSLFSNSFNQKGHLWESTGGAKGARGGARGPGVGPGGPGGQGGQGGPGVGPGGQGARGPGGGPSSNAGGPWPPWPPAGYGPEYIIL